MPVVESDIRSILVELGGIPNHADADVNANLYLDVGLSSFHALQLLTELEERFSVNIPDGDFVEATTIARLTSTVNRLLEQRD